MLCKQTLITFYRPSEERWKANSAFGRHADFVDWLYAERNVKSTFMLPKYITNVKFKEKAARFQTLLLQCQRGKNENQYVTRKEYFDNWGYHFAYATWWVSFLSIYMTLFCLIIPDISFELYFCFVYTYWRRKVCQSLGIMYNSE